MKLSKIIKVMIIRKHLTQQIKKQANENQHIKHRLEKQIQLLPQHPQKNLLNLLAVKKKEKVNSWSTPSSTRKSGRNVYKNIQHAADDDYHEDDENEDDKENDEDVDFITTSSKKRKMAELKSPRLKKKLKGE